MRAAPAPRGPAAKLEIRDLRIRFGEREVVNLSRLDLGDGEILGLAGESGSGKSMTALAIAGLAGTLGAKVEGRIRLDGLELVGLPDAELRDIRGRRLAMIFQSPVSSFNPVFRVGDVFVRALRLHGARSKAEAREQAGEALRNVLLSPDLLERYPHQLSGGQAQRVAIAIALALRSEVLLADEPTSALDVTVQAEILEILRRLRNERGMSVLFISHDLAVIAELCDRIAVMRHGRVVEEGQAALVLGEPRHPYARELVAAVPKVGRGLVAS
ncbi:MAG: ABC transporter ATP-binding protein [Actinobacteria bacterium]|nr:ABC transporter ATP-binding protein [Actinomycetota bacterium]